MSVCWKPAWCECPDCGPLVAIEHEDYCGYPDDCNCAKRKAADR